MPPIYDSLITDHSYLDGRSKYAPSQWNENFRIFYLTEKMRSQADPQFSALSDRVKTGKINERDIAFFNSRIVDCPSERVNENFKSGKLSIIVTTNSKKDVINQ